MAKRHLRLVTPATVNRTVTPRRPPNADLRTREYLTEAEVERLMKAAKRNRWGHRDATMILVAYRHGLRVSELVDLRWDQVEFSDGHAARPQGQAGHAEHPSDPRGRAAGAAAAPARAGAQVALRVHLGARRALQHRWVRPHGRAGGQRGQARLQGAPAHAEARLRLRAGQQGARHARAASLPRPPQHSAHGALHRAVADAVQGFLARLRSLSMRTLAPSSNWASTWPCSIYGPRVDNCPTPLIATVAHLPYGLEIAEAPMSYLSAWAIVSLALMAQERARVRSG